MPDRLDSRSLRFTDCYGQRFMKPGTYRYHVLAAGGPLVDPEKPFVIRVGERKSENVMNQQIVILKYADRRFAPDKPELTIEAGDLVTWNCPDPKAPGYAVQGDKEFFGSTRLVNECGFSHAFGSEGTYEWADAYGSGLGGVVRVVNPKGRSEADLAAWRDRLATAVLVMIDKGEAQPAAVDVVTGQTVYFAVTTSGGVSVTDRPTLGRNDEESRRATV
jgi:plastocyanin